MRDVEGLYVWAQRERERERDRMRGVGKGRPLHNAMQDKVRGG